MTERFAVLKEKTNGSYASHVPLFFRLKSTEDQHRLNQLIENEPEIQIFDEIHAQVEELIKLRNPRIRPDKALLMAKAVELMDGPSEHYGVWVYYPWSRRLVHILEETEFIEVRTNRNQNKITKTQHALLAKKILGVVGLSVGKTISIIMAMERSFGEIRIADFDTLELSNLNRLQTGIHSLGLRKTVIAAREILEIDPFLNVKCFDSGLIENNIDEFFTGGGKLDLIVDECDSLDIKILLRFKAKSLRIPVVMDMNDRGTLDVERFDLEPDRPLLHGLIDHLDLGKIKGLSNIEKIPYILPMLGQKTISAELKASILEMGQTLSTWPQLSSSVSLGGAVAADLCRRIWLDEFHDSGRYWVDIEEQICDEGLKNPPVQVEFQPDLKINVDNNLIIDASVLDTCIRSAPAIGNYRNWDIDIRKESLSIDIKPKRAGTNTFSFELIDLINAGHLADQLAYFANVDQLKVAYNQSRVTIDLQNVDFTPPFEQPEHDYQYGIANENEPAVVEKVTSILKDLDIEASVYPTAKMPKALLEALISAEKSKHLHPFWSNIHMNHFINQGGKTQGVDIDRFDFNDSEKALLDLGADPNVIDLLNRWKGGEIFSKIYESRFRASKGFFFIAENIGSKINVVTLGTKLNRLLIQLNHLDIIIEPMPALPLILCNSDTHFNFEDSISVINALMVKNNEVPAFIGRII